QLMPYFELDRVLKDGVFFAANRLYGLTFKQRTDLPVYHPDVRVFEVFDADGTSLALWYCDYFKRDNKSGGAWEDSFVDGAGVLGPKPVVFHVAKFTEPTPAASPSQLTRTPPPVARPGRRDARVSRGSQGSGPPSPPCLTASSTRG